MLGRYQLNNGWMLAGGMASLAVIGSTYYHFKRKKQDDIAAKLLVKLKAILNPSADGLLGEVALDPNYHIKMEDKINNLVKIHPKKAVRAAKKIKGAWKEWYEGGDNEEEVYQVFKNLDNKVAISQVADAYKKYGGLRLALKTKLDDDEISEVLKIISSRPSFITKAKHRK